MQKFEGVQQRLGNAIFNSAEFHRCWVRARVSKEDFPWVSDCPSAHQGKSREWLVTLVCPSVIASSYARNAMLLLASTRKTLVHKKSVTERNLL